MGIAASSGAKKDKQNNDDTTFCIICYENDIKTQRLACGHVFCSDCVSSIYVYEVWPRCPLCRQNICDRQTNQKLSRGRFDWFKICRRTANLSIAAVSCSLFYYQILPSMHEYLQDWNFTALQELLDDFRIEYGYGRVKEI